MRNIAEIDDSARDDQETENVCFPATYAGMSQKADGEITLKLNLDASQLGVLQKLASEWKDRGLLIAAMPAMDEAIAGD